MFTLNQGQEFIVQEAVKWYYKSPEQVFQYDGPPGAGKSVVLDEIVRRLNLNINTEIAPMSFIGSASLVMRMKGLFSAKTAHSWIYDVITVKKYNPNTGKEYKVQQFVKKSTLGSMIKLIIVDEAYCMPDYIAADIKSFGIKIIACGDQNQLPPVKALPGFLVNGKIYHLTEVMRQQGLDDIVFIANRAMMRLPLLNGYYGNSMVIDFNDITDSMLLWADVVICCKNSTRDYFNHRIRTLKGYYTILPLYGERLVCRNNNWNKEIKDRYGNSVNLVNGLIGTVLNSPDISSYSRKDKVIDIIFKPDLVDSTEVFITTGNYNYLVGDSISREEIKSNHYYKGDLFEYAYAITCHVAQGGQFHKVIYIEEVMQGNIQSSLNLVGATRADQQLIYVKPPSYEQALEINKKAKEINNKQKFEAENIIDYSEKTISKNKNKYSKANKYKPNYNGNADYITD